MQAAAETEERRESAARDSSIARVQSLKRRESQASSAAAPARAPLPVQADSAAESKPSVETQVTSASSTLRAPEAWLQEIRDLRKAGKVADADREWREFKTAYVEFEVAPDDFARPVETRE
jgi:hypothetical protein